jgi:hypothetical protein
MKLKCVGAIACAAACLAVAVAPAVAAEPTGDPPATMYEPTTVDVIHLALSQAEEEKLDSDPETYVKGTFSLAETDGTPGGEGPSSMPMNVEVRLKGQLGSKRTLAQKAAFKLKFKKTERFLGLKKMTLNNMVQDPSEIHETLAYKAFRSMDVAAPRTGYAYVYLNGVDYGLHLNVETPDDVALEKRFGPFQHLYEGDYGADVETGSAVTPAEVEVAAEKFEIDEGIEEAEVEGEKFRADLEALIVAVNSPGPGAFSTRVAAFADLKEMTRMWAVEKYIGHWDGYSGLEGELLPNNYYLFSDLAGQFQMLPWGTDQTWSVHLGFSGDAGILFDKCLADQSCATMYRRSLRETQVAIDGDELASLASSTATLLKPWEALEQGNGDRHGVSQPEIAGAVQGVREFIASRPAELANYLDGQPAPEPAANLALTLAPASTIADGASTTTATATVTDAEGNPVSGDEVAFSSSDGSDRIGAVTAHIDGVYTAQITSSTAVGTPTVTAVDTSVSPGATGTAVLAQTAGPAAHVAIDLQPTSIPADGISTTTATATITDATGHPVRGDRLSFASSDGAEQIGTVVDRGNGTYSASITSSDVAGTPTITATDTSVDPGLSDATTLVQAPLPPSAGSNPVPLATLTRPAPAVTLTGGPRRHTRDRRPTFKFDSSDPAATFECKLDSHELRPCGSPDTLPRLAPGAHVFSVGAVDGAGRAGPVASYRFFVEPGRAQRRSSDSRS